MAAALPALRATVPEQLGISEGQVHQLLLQRRQLRQQAAGKTQHSNIMYMETTLPQQLDAGGGYGHPSHLQALPGHPKQAVYALVCKKAWRMHALVASFPALTRLLCHVQARSIPVLPT
jgi:hypothetical protein